MTKDTVVAFRAPDGFSPDPLTDLLRRGARQLIAQAVEAELNGCLTAHADQTDAAGRKRLVRHGHLPEREVQTGIGAVPVKVPRVRDRAAEGERLKFTSTILPPYLRRAKSIEELLPWLYLKGISTGDFSEALTALLGPDAPGLSASTICLTNNAAERSLRGVALGRKSRLFAGSERGGQRAAAMYTLIGTAKLNDIDPQAWLADVIARISDMPVSRLPELLPWNWQKQAPRSAEAA